MANTILYAFISVSFLGAFFGIGLAIAGKYLTVKKDERLSQLEGLLPNYNCGACGFPGCSGYAEAVATGKAEPTLCTAGGAEVAMKLAGIMGVTIDVSQEKKIAQVHCCGGKDSSLYSFEYIGVSDCNALYSLYQGNKVCKYGCLGLGSCIKVCPSDAIAHDNQGLVYVNKNKCISCGKCIGVCPVGVIKMIPVSADFIVSCNSKDKGAATKKACKVGCIGCKMCEKKSPDGGFKIENFLASIDYNVKGERKTAADACPSKCILQK